MTVPSENFSTESLRLAAEMLEDARIMLQRGRHRSAVDRAYYAMFHAARAVLYLEGAELPKTHAGLRNLFGKRFLLTKILPTDIGRWLGHAFLLRQQSDYEVHAELDKEPVEEAVVNAGRFVQLLAAYMQSSNPGGKEEEE